MVGKVSELLAVEPITCKLRKAAMGLACSWQTGGRAAGRKGDERWRVEEADLAGPCDHVGRLDFVLRAPAAIRGFKTGRAIWCAS